MLVPSDGCSCCVPQVVPTSGVARCAASRAGSCELRDACDSKAFPTRFAASSDECAPFGDAVGCCAPRALALSAWAGFVLNPLVAVLVTLAVVALHRALRWRRRRQRRPRGMVRLAELERVHSGTKHTDGDGDDGDDGDVLRSAESAPSSESDSSAECCSICLYSFRAPNDDRVACSCGQPFHERCLLDWLCAKRDEQRCPICRRDFIADENANNDNNEANGDTDAPLDPMVAISQRALLQAAEMAVAAQNINPRSDQFKPTFNLFHYGSAAVVSLIVGLLLTRFVGEFLSKELIDQTMMLGITVSFHYFVFVCFSK